MNDVETPTEMRGVILPLNQTRLLLPNVTVAEVIGYREGDAVFNAPGWLMGSITWRQRVVPLIRYDYFFGQTEAKIGYRARIALCHNLAGNSKMPFLGLICDSIPRLARINQDNVSEEDSGEVLPQMVLKKLSYQGEEAWIPDLDSLAAAASGYLFRD